MGFCNSCGRPVGAEARFCPRCSAAAATEGHVGPRPKAPLASHLLGLAGLGLVLLNVPVVWIARSNDWRVSDGVVILIVALFIGGVGLVGLAALVRNSAGVGKL